MIESNEFFLVPIYVVKTNYCHCKTVVDLFVIKIFFEAFREVVLCILKLLKV